MILTYGASGLAAARHFRAAQGDLGLIAQRLASGLRLTHAARDPAGLSISERVRSQAIGYSRVLQGMQDAISVLQVADGAMDEMGAMLHRMRELAVAAANGALGDAERTQLQVEVEDLAKSISAIVRSTNWNTMLIFRGGVSNTELFLADVTINDPAFIDSADASTQTTPGTYTAVVTQRPERAAVIGTTPLPVVTAGETLIVNGVSIAISGSRANVLSQINARSDETGVAAFLGDGAKTLDDGTTVVPVNHLVLQTVDYGPEQEVRVKSTGDDAGFSLVPVSDSGVDLEGTLGGTALDGMGLTIVGTSGPIKGLSVILAAKAPGTAFGIGESGSVTVDIVPNDDPLLADDFELNIQAGPGEEDSVMFSIPNLSVHLSQTMLLEVNVESTSAARTAISSIDAFLTTLNAFRVGIGGQHAHAQFLANQASIAFPNLADARSRIADADAARDVTDLVKSSLSQQTALAGLLRSGDAIWGAMRIVALQMRLPVGAVEPRGQAERSRAESTDRPGGSLARGGLTSERERGGQVSADQGRSAFVNVFG